MNPSDGFRFRHSFSAQKQMADIAFSLLRLRAETPAGEWVDEHFAGSYERAWDRARSLAGAQAHDDVLLSALNLADVLLDFLVAATGIEKSEWLTRLHTDYIDPIDPEGTGVWSTRQLRL